LKAEVAALVPPELASRIIWIEALRDPAEVFSVYRCCDVLALTSQYDAWALVVNEATASGMALVCSDVVGSTAELLRNGVNGRMFPANDLPGLVTALRDVMNEEKLPAMQAASRQLLAEWRRVGDPVKAFRQAMRACGVM
jgi:glycosyltransferase involved in cell wall biosynthesis